MSGMASALIAPGAIVAGKYRLDAIVGEGGMGSVWSATHTGLGQAVAIKFISREFVSSSEALRRFDAEAKAAAQLRSRHVVQVFDNGTLEDGTPYIAMELLRGESLYGRVHRAGPVPLHEAVEIIAQCCKALGRAHAAGIVHRDIKPDNIFLAQSADDEGFLVKILDFGIAKFSVGPNDHSATRTGAVLGTPLYMSPEQARGLKSIDHRTDLYSLGLVAYTIFTGNLAFSSESFGDLLLQICTAPLPSLCGNAPWLPSTLEGWFQRACARDPENRFPSAQELGEALRLAAGGVGIAAAVPAGAVPGGAAALPGAPIPSPGVAGHPAQAVSLGTDVAMSRSGPVTASSDEQNRPKRRGPLVAVVVLLLVGGLGVAALAALATRGRAPDAPPSAAVGAVRGAAVEAPVVTLAMPAVVRPPEPATDHADAVNAEPTDVAPPARAPSVRDGTPEGSSHATAAGAAPGRAVPASHSPAPPAGASSRGVHSAAGGPAKPIDLGY